ncbi:10801_t:CDS:10 [Funneliformis caledonium]|uniref:10801_t:CDS:1 n=1 Tax=Funneliformis caledonium TaxID=1117310 RepID=A0A9N8ZYD2_9GLOM|nr:10801_t:CDS:10 [Funneliformis caledonium]
MSREDNQITQQPQEGLAGEGTEASEGSHRILINDPIPTNRPIPKRHQSAASPRRRNKRNKRKSLRKRHSHRRADDDVDENLDDNEDDENESDHELTLKDRQEAINITHPFGLRLWKPALYKKLRTVTRNADSALHSTPSPGLYLSFGNILWAICFGWWLALTTYMISFIMLESFGGSKYARVFRELSYYIFWPFGKFVEKIDENGEEQNEDQTDYFNRRDSNDMEIEDNEDRPLLGRSLNINSRRNSHSEKFNFFEKLDEIGLFGVIFYFWFFLVIAPLYLLVSAICWFSVFSIPMARLIYVLLGHLRKHPLSLHFRSGSASKTSSKSEILLCTDKALGSQYYKYTYDGINIFFINLMSIVFFVMIDDYFLVEIFSPEKYFFTTPVFIFILSLISVIPLSYFIGMAVASISAQSSIGMGAVINATFGSIIEILLYAIALEKGQGKLMEGSIIGSFMAGVLLMPGVSMISGGLKRKEQRFNAKSAGVTSTMLIMAIIGTLTPTLFFQTYAPYRMTCEPCNGNTESMVGSCQVCTHSVVEPTETSIYKERVKPLMYFCAIILVLSYLIGLWFTLRTHAALVYQTHATNPQSIYQRLVPINIIQQFLPHSISHSQTSNHPHPQNQTNSLQNAASQHISFIRHPHEHEEEEEIGGHDSPNWGKVKSGIVLLSCTAFYSLIAEILVNNVSVVLDNVSISEKMLGLTLFALVPNVTEFLNAMSFALYGNIALSMEIGSAYAIQVCLLQIPAMVAISAWLNQDKSDEQQRGHTFTLVFPRWDVFSVVFSVFLLTYTYIEGKSNYFKGSILILSYLVLMAGFFYAPDTAYDSYNV